MALTATIHTIDIDLADHDRGVFETLALRVARHPSESEDYLVTRVIAYALEHRDGIQFSRGISDPDAPTIFARDLTGGLQLWVEIGSPEAARLHKAAKASPRVAVYTHKDPAQLLDRLRGASIHRASGIAIYAIDRALIAQVAAQLERRMSFALSRSGDELYVSTEAGTISGRIVTFSVG